MKIGLFVSYIFCDLGELTQDQIYGTQLDLFLFKYGDAEYDRGQNTAPSKPVFRSSVFIVAHVSAEYASHALLSS